jgi:hypothetical protein
MSEHKKDTCQSLFTGIKELVNQILFVTDVAGEQIRHEQIGRCRLVPRKMSCYSFDVLVENSEQR